MFGKTVQLICRTSKRVQELCRFSFARSDYRFHQSAFYLGRRTFQGDRTWKKKLDRRTCKADAFSAMRRLFAHAYVHEDVDLREFENHMQLLFRTPPPPHPSVNVAFSIYICLLGHRFGSCRSQQ